MMDKKMCATVKPLEWAQHPTKDIWRADGGFGSYKVFGIGAKPTWDFDSWSDANDKISCLCDTVDEAFSAAQADCDARILSAITLRPEAEVRAEAWAAAIEAALDAADKYMRDQYGIGALSHPIDRGRILDSLYHPADARAALDRIKAEAKAEGMREAARIAADHTPEKHGGAPLAAHVTGKSIELAILAAIPQTTSTASESDNKGEMK